MTENEFIYKRLKYLNDQIEGIIETNEMLLSTVENLTSVVNQLSKVVIEQGSPEYIAKANKMNEAKEVMEKAKYFRDMLKNNK